MMILNRYVLRQALITLLISVSVFTFVLLLGQVFKELSRMLVQQRVGLDAVGWFLLLTLPYVLSFSLPMAMLAASLLVFGRLSADNEITAMRASGVGLTQIMAPVILLAAVAAGLCFYINSSVAPRCKFSFKTFFLQQALENPMALLVEGTAIRDFPGYVLYVGQRDDATRTVQDVILYSLDNNGKAISRMNAARATVTALPAERKLLLDLENVHGDMRDPSDPMNVQKIRPGIRAQRYPVELDLSTAMRRAQGTKRKSEMTLAELREQIRTLREARIYPAVELLESHQRASMAFACLAFAFVGIPLGIKTSRRETSIGIAISLALALGYYLVVVLANALKFKIHLYPEIILWSPNLLFQLIGLWLIWRVSRH